MRGVNKMVIEVKSPENEYFERAILFLKPESGGASQSELSSGAEKLLASVKRRKNSGVPLPLTLLIAAAAALIAAGTVLLLL